jgi:hypothetical protein
VKKPQKSLKKWTKEQWGTKSGSGLKNNGGLNQVSLLPKVKKLLVNDTFLRKQEKL